MVIVNERESRLKTTSALSLFLTLSIATVGIAASVQPSTAQSASAVLHSYDIYIFWTAFFLIPTYAALRLYSQWTREMGFALRLVMGIVCGGITAVIVDAFVVTWLGGMRALVGFEPLWGWPFAVLCTFLLAPFRFERETRVARLLLFTTLAVSTLVMLLI